MENECHLKKEIIIVLLLIIIILSGCQDEPEPICGNCQYLEDRQCFDYACCSDSDCDDNNVITRDACLNPSSKIANCQHYKERCNDGTQKNQCSETKSLLCNNDLQLVESCFRCGCPEGLRCHYDKCEKIECGFHVAADKDSESYTKSRCKDNKPETFDNCINPGKPESYCVNKNNIKIGIIEFERPDTQYQSTTTCEGENDFKELFHDKKGYASYASCQYPLKMYSLYYLDDFIIQEAKRYGVENINVELDVKGVYVLNDIPEDKLKAIPRTDAEYDITLVEYFKRKLVEHGITKESYDYIVIVFYDDWISKKRTSDLFTSKMVETWLVLVDMSTHIRSEAVEDILHETFHLLGQHNELYETPSYGALASGCNLDKGVPKPGVFPQKQACVMCGFRVESVDPPKYISAQIDELMVCEASAEALGWVDG